MQQTPARSGLERQGRSFASVESDRRQMRRQRQSGLRRTRNKSLRTMENIRELQGRCRRSASKDHSLDRRENDKGYGPDNFRWATRAEQNRNRRNTKMLSYLGCTKPLCEWAESIGVPFPVLQAWIARGMDPAVALTMPYKKRGPRPHAKDLVGLWRNMIYKCHHENSPDYHMYGAKGIRVCDRWRESYEAFVEDMGPRPSPQHSVDRKENSKGYEPENCRWATSLEQNNNKTTNITLTFNGKPNQSLNGPGRSGLAKSDWHID